MDKKLQTIEMVVASYNDYDKEYSYQEELTKELDKIDGDFNQAIINEIVLWKVNRYVKLDDNTLASLNKIPNKGRVNEELTKEVLKLLLNTKGIRLAMASTILRFKNPSFFQIIDQRVYRFIKGEVFKESTNVEKQIECYLEYLDDLKKVCQQKGIDFSKSDRILYEIDKQFNKNISIKY